MDSVVPLSQLRPIEDAPEVARKRLFAAGFGGRRGGGRAAAPGHGHGRERSDPGSVGSRPRRPAACPRFAKGRFFSPGLAEIVVGKNAVTTYAGLDLGTFVKFGGLTWAVVGILDSGGSAFDSELWADADLVNQAYQRPKGLFQSATARLVSPEALATFKKTLEADPRLTVQVESEVEYYAKASRMITT